MDRKGIRRGACGLPDLVELPCPVDQTIADSGINWVQEQNLGSAPSITWFFRHRGGRWCRSVIVGILDRFRGRERRANGVTVLVVLYRVGEDVEVKMLSNGALSVGGNKQWM